MNRHGLLIMFFAVLLLCIGVVAAAQKTPDVHDEGVFELDGNAIHGNMIPPGDDWDNVLLGGGGASLVSTGLITDLPSAADDNFTSGGSKDVNDVSQWQWTINSVPNKDDLLHAFAAIYRMPSDNHIHIYFGADRYADNGDSQIGFWFFVNKISKNADGTFSGTHAVGDLLVLSDFTQGGSIPGFTVYEWVGSGGDQGSLQTLLTGVDCTLSPPGDTVCGRVNSDNQPSPWPFQSNGPHDPPNTFLPGEFFEAGLDLTALIPNAACLSSFMAETRSAATLSAQLEDFVLGTFDTCKITVDKTGPALSKVGDPTLYTYTVTNDGISPLYLQSAVDDKIGDLTSQAQASCGTLLPGQTCTFTASYVVQPNDPDPLVNNVTVTYNTAQDFSGAQITGNASFSVNLFQPSVLIKKSGPAMALVGDNVPYTFRITNTSSSDSPNLNLASISDSVLGDLSSYAAAAGCTSLAPGAFCQFTVSRVVQASDPNPLVNTVDVLYHPQGFPNDIRSSDSHSVTIVHPSVAVTKQCDAFGLVGEPDHYTITVTNTGDVALEKVSLNDSLLGALTGADTLAPGASATLTLTRVILASDPNPLPNTVTALYQIPAGTGVSAQVTASASCATTILHPAVTVTKSCDAYGLIGQPDHYTITVTNTGDVALEKVSLSDSLLGALTGADNLAPGASATLTPTRIILASDPNPLPNTVTALYQIPAGMGVTAQVTASASCATTILHPSVSVSKLCDQYGLIGQPDHYTITVTNTGDVALEKVSLNDSLLGALTGADTLAPGASATLTPTRIIQPNDPNPLPNTVTALYQIPAGMGVSAQVTAQASCATVILHPGVSISKVCDQYGLIGQPDHYTIVVTNTGDVALEKVSLSDSLLGALTGADNLAPGASATLTPTRIILASDPNPLPNTVTALYQIPAGMGVSAQVTAQASCSTVILHPGISISKLCDQYGLIGQPDHYTIVVTNTGDVALAKVSLNDSLLGTLSGADTLAPGASATLTPTRIILATDPNPLPNTVTALYQIPAGMGVSAQVTAQASCSTVILHPNISIAKACDAFAVIGGTVNYHITITNTGDVPLVQDALGDTLLGPLSGCTVLAPGQICTIDASRVVLATDPDPLPNTATALYEIAPGFGVFAQVSASANCATDIVHPEGTITKTCLTNPVPVGASANFQINVANTGDVPLTIHLQDPTTGLDTTFTLGVNPSPPCGLLVNDPANGCYMTEVSIVATGSTVLNAATIDATLDPSYGIPGIVYSDSASAFCTVQQGGATRTLGFWATHCDYTQHVFNVHLGGNMNIGWRNITSASDLFGIFWANNARNSNGTKRGQLCQAKETVANQVLAAILNSALTNGTPLPVPLSTIQSIMSGTNVTAIRNLGTTLGNYNQSGDTVAIVDGDGYAVQPANPACAKALANIPYADCP